MPRRFQFIVCKVLQREAYYCAARSENIVDVVPLAQGLHNEPAKLNGQLQKALQRTEDVQSNRYDATLLGYGLCCNGIAGLSCQIDLVVPRAHDCITLLLGSKEKYQRFFESHPGTYWYSRGWIETGTQPGVARRDKLLAEYIEKFGPENAEYLMSLEADWAKHYKYATFIDWPLPGSEYYKNYTARCAREQDWEFKLLKGDPSLLQRLVDGRWDDSDFQLVRPDQRIEEDVNQMRIIKAVTK